MNYLTSCLAARGYGLSRLIGALSLSKQAGERRNAKVGCTEKDAVHGYRRIKSLGKNDLGNRLPNPYTILVQFSKENRREVFIEQRTVVVGGGASGALVAAGMLRRMRTGHRVTVIEPKCMPGRGVAYGSSQRCLVLNVRAANMSAFPDDPGHFSRWLLEKGIVGEKEASTVFATRGDYGTYIGDVLRSACEGSPGELVTVRDSAVSLKRDPDLAVITEGGLEIPADRVVLALGNFPPCCPSALRPYFKDPNFIPNPWNCEILDQIRPNDTVFMVGTGLTMIDGFLLLQSLGHKGKVVARSRRGLLPKPHRIGKPIPIEASELEGGDVIGMVIKKLRLSGEDWRATLDGLRPHSVALWQSLSWVERGRFLDRLRPYWDVFRHRIPETAAASIHEAIKSGQLDVGADRILEVAKSADGFDIGFRDRANPISAQWVVNCTGPTLDIGSQRIPILESVVEANLASYDPIGLGLMVDDAGRTEAEGRLWALGALCRGCRWETTAIPEIRVQAARIASEILP